MRIFDKMFGPPSRDVFAREMMTALRRLGDRDDIVYERDEFRLVRPKSKRVTNLGTVYVEHCALPRSERKAHLQRLAEGFLLAHDDLPEDFDEVRPHLRPKVWTRAQFADLELRQRLEGDDELNIPMYPLGEHLLTTVVYDMPSSMRTLSNDNFERWNITYYEALEIARQNLEESTLAWASIGDSVHSAMSADNYDSSRLLLTDRVRQFAVAGDPIALVAARDSLQISGSDDPDGLRIMLDLVEKTLQEDPRPLSGIPLRLVDDEWEDWQPPPEHPLFDRFSLLRQEFLGSLYADQQKLLSAVLEQEEPEVFVAGFSGVEEAATGRVRTYCVWGEGVDSMLPETEYIVLPTMDSLNKSTKSGPPHGGKWDDVRAIVGDLMQPVPDLYPSRWRVREFPPQHLLDAIGTMEM